MPAEVILKRRMTSPIHFTEEQISDEEIAKMLDVARWAPTHKMTQPWRFVVLRDKALERMEKFAEAAYTQRDDPLSPKKLERKLLRFRKAQAIIVILMHRDAAERIPEWEEIAAVACAVENMWIYACNSGMGGYWSTPGYIKAMGEFIPLEAEERCLGLFYLGRPLPDLPDNRHREPVENYSRWVYE